MEQEVVLQVLDPDNDDHHHRQPPTTTVDTSRPFRSVKEAVAIFGERFLVPEIYTPKPFTFPKREIPFFSPSPLLIDKEPHSNYTSLTPSPRCSIQSSHGDNTKLSDIVKKLEAELEETKVELKLLKERESETEVALASLNAELHQNMSKLARAEAAVAARAARSASVRGGDAAADGGETAMREEEKKRDARGGASPSLAQILSVGEREGLFDVMMRKERRMAKKKKKPIIPLVGDLFSRKKGTSITTHNPLYASSNLQWN